MIEIKEKVPLFIDHHPYYESLNKKLMKDSVEYIFQDPKDVRNVDGGETNVRAFHTPNTIKSPSISLIHDWVLSLSASRIQGWKFVIPHTWMIKYNKGDYTINHGHVPAIFSFVYFIKCPRGSSPLVFTTSGKKIKAEEGKLVVSPGHVMHYVPKNRCDDRITLAGNVYLQL